MRPTATTNPHASDAPHHRSSNSSERQRQRSDSSDTADAEDVEHHNDAQAQSPGIIDKTTPSSSSSSASRDASIYDSTNQETPFTSSEDENTVPEISKLLICTNHPRSIRGPQPSQSTTTATSSTCKKQSKAISYDS